MSDAIDRLLKRCEAMGVPKDVDELRVMLTTLVRECGVSAADANTGLLEASVMMFSYPMPTDRGEYVAVYQDRMRRCLFWGAVVRIVREDRLAEMRAVEKGGGGA